MQALLSSFRALISCPYFSLFIYRQVVQSGSFGGIYFNPHGGKPSTKWPKGVPVDHTEFPEDWFEGLHPDYYLARRYIAKRNKYQAGATMRPVSAALLSLL